MPGPIRWLLLSLGALFLVAIAGVAVLTSRSHMHEGTYCGSRTGILHIGERVVPPNVSNVLASVDSKR
jgi:hypothetical protein